MANKDFQIPIRGYSAGLSTDKQPPLTTEYIDNMYPRGTLEKKIRLVQRPGKTKIFTDLIGGDNVAIIAMLSVTTVD